MLRENPPLLQHMLEDELPFITKLLGERLVRETIYLNHHDALRDFVGDLAFKFRQRAAQLNKQKGGLLTVQHQRALARADDFAKGITGDVSLTPEIKSAPPIRRQRANPPLTQHMETEELSDLSSLLAERLVREIVANKDGSLLAAFLGDLGTQFRSSVRKVPRHKLSDQHAAILSAADDFAAEIEGFAGSSVSRRRANPPLSEHMAHDDLEDIMFSLAGRLAQESPEYALTSLVQLLDSIYSYPEIEKVAHDTRQTLSFFAVRDYESGYRKELAYALSNALTALAKGRKAIEYWKQREEDG